MASQYHDVYAHWKDKPFEFWGEAAKAGGLDQAAADRVRSERGRLRPLVSGRHAATPATTRSTAT